MIDKKEKINIHFDVVNSVKGGSGKSFFALQLAAYHVVNGRKTYIIDLDLRGTSWETNYGKYIIPPDSQKGNTIEEWKNNGHKYPYIDRLMWHYEDYESCGIWSSIKVRENGSGSDHTVSLCIAETGNYRKVDQLEEDLFENTIFEMIRKIKDEQDEPDEKDVHIILDMPPSYEKHAERILTHLLLSTNSPFENMDKDFSYMITLFMISTIDPAHFIQNAHYVRSLFMDRQFSSTIVAMLKSSNLRIQPVVNDVTDGINISSEPGKEKNILPVISAKNQSIWEKLKVERADLKEYIQEPIYIEHISSLDSIKEFYKPTMSKDYILLYDDPKQAFKSIML